MEKSSNPDFFKSKVLGHPAGLFVLFFTEMWERFSFYGMRVLLINFLTMAAIGINPGWEWSSENAGALFGTYAGLLYLTPILGGYIADKITGYRLAVLIGAIIMTAGHASMAFETEASLYIGLALLVIGTGFFKPNMTSIISEMYKDVPEKKDGAYTIFYMGVNAGAFFGMMLCGYLGEKVGWSWGFGLAGIFMLLGSIQFWLAKPLFGSIGDKPNKNLVQSDEERLAEENNPNEGKRNPFTGLDKVLIFISAAVGLLYIFNDPSSKIANIHLLPEEIMGMNGPALITGVGLLVFLFLVSSRISRYDKVVRNRMIAVVIFAFFTVLFWMSFEQGATSLVLFARDFTQRTLVGDSATIFKIVNTLLTVIPLGIITWVLLRLFKETANRIATSNIVLAGSFVVVWGIVGWMLWKDYNAVAYKVSYQVVETPSLNKEGEVIKNEDGKPVLLWAPVEESRALAEGDRVRDTQMVVSSQVPLEVNQQVNIHVEKGNFVLLDDPMSERIRSDYQAANKASMVVPATVTEEVTNQIEVTASWFSILNSFFIIAFASFFSKWWESKYNPPGAVKYGLGLAIMGLGFGMLAIGSSSIPQGAEPGIVRVSMVWLILAYLFHTLGELCSSPVGLSYVSKLVPGRMIAFMFGMWYLAIAIGNKLAANLGGAVEQISEEYSLSAFFLIFTIVPISAGILVAALNPLLKRLMGGVK